MGVKRIAPDGWVWHPQARMLVPSRRPLVMPPLRVPKLPRRLRIYTEPYAAIAVRTISTPARETGQTGATSYTITSTTAGDLLIAGIAWYQAEAAAITGITGAGTWASAKSQNLDANSHIAIWYAPNVSGGATSISVTTNDDGDPTAKMQITVIHCSDAATASPLDVAPTATTGTGVTPSITSGTLSQADEIVIQMNSHTGADLTTMVEDSGDGFTEANQNLDNDDGQCFELQYKVVAATTSLAVAATYNASRAWGAILASFKGVGGAPAANPKGVFGLALDGPLRRVVYP